MTVNQASTSLHVIMYTFTPIYDLIMHCSYNYNHFLLLLVLQQASSHDGVKLYYVDTTRSI